MPSSALQSVGQCMNVVETLEPIISSTKDLMSSS